MDDEGGTEGRHGRCGSDGSEWHGPLARISTGTSVVFGTLSSSHNPTIIDSLLSVFAYMPVYILSVEQKLHAYEIYIYIKQRDRGNIEEIET